MIRHKLISTTVATILDEANIVSPAIDVKAIAHSKGAIVVEEPLKNDDFSGFLYTTPGSPPVIGVNSQHSLSRRRFTIAHELGHLLLHPKTGVHLDQVVIQRRDSKASTGTDDEEIEANRFAAELLMPRGMLEADLEALGQFHADDGRAIELLAKRYMVSPQAMTIRLSSLGLVTM